MKYINLTKPYQFFFETLSNRSRWHIVHLLKEKPCRVNDIANNLGLEQSLISHHLKRLEICGFVKKKANGREKIYSLNKETIGHLLTLIDNHVERFCTNCIKNNETEPSTSILKNEI